VYHSSRDDAETLNYDKIEKASRLLYLVLEEAGNNYKMFPWLAQPADNK
jgi:hypothetical protein